MDVNGFLNVDKPRGLTSHDVVARLRRALGTRRVGHAGTLDPAATGVLVVAVGGATRLLRYFDTAGKQYVAHVVLGVATDSADVEGRVLRTGSAPVPDRAAVEAALQSLTGTVEQVPPAFSAIKVGGQALYRRARRGEVVEVPARTVTIHSIRVLSYAYPDVFLLIDCGTGVYVRSIARDLGDALGTGAYLHALLRTRVGAFQLGDAWPLSVLEQARTAEAWRSVALHPDVALRSEAAIVLHKPESEAWYHGRPIVAPDAMWVRLPGLARAYRENGVWVGAAAPDPAGVRWQPRLVVS